MVDKIKIICYNNNIDKQKRAKNKTNIKLNNMASVSHEKKYTARLPVVRHMNGYPKGRAVLQNSDIDGGRRYGFILFIKLY